MPKRISKKERDDAIFGLWNRYLSHFGMREAMKIVYGAYKVLREQDKRLRAKHGKEKKTNRRVKVHRKDTREDQTEIFGQ